MGIDLEVLKSSIRDVPDFPKQGILFKDITTLLKEPQRFREVVDLIGERYINSKIDYVVCVEARGFIFGAAIAYKLGAGLVPVRKKGKLPAETIEETYELEYGTDTLAIHKDAIESGKRVLIVDDLLATGGTINAVVRLAERLGAEIEELAFLIELSFLNGRKRLEGHKIFSVIEY